MVMMQQGGEWRLFVDFPFKENILKEHKDAVDLYHKHDYDKAIAAYQKILDELDKEQATGNAASSTSTRAKWPIFRTRRSSCPMRRRTFRKSC